VWTNLKLISFASESMLEAKENSGDDSLAHPFINMVWIIMLNKKTNDKFYYIICTNMCLK